MKACIILHNMIVEDRRSNTSAFDFDISQMQSIIHPDSIPNTTPEQRYQKIRNRQLHFKLRNDLVESCAEYSATKK